MEKIMISQPMNGFTEEQIVETGNRFLEFATNRISDFMEAHEAWAKCVDHGNAKEYATYNLTDLTGKMYTKTFYANGQVVIR